MIVISILSVRVTFSSLAPGARDHTLFEKSLIENDIHFRLSVLEIGRLCKNTEEITNKRCDDVDDSHQHCFSFSWDNGDTEKMSPWDMEPIPDDGRSLQYTDTTVRTHLNYISLQMYHLYNVNTLIFSFSVSVPLRSHVP